MSDADIHQTPADMPHDKTKKGQPKKWKRRFWKGFKILLALAVFFHLYVISLRFINPPPTILMMQRGMAGEDVRRDWTKLEDISPNMFEAVMGGEDSRFCEHRGVDFQAIEKAIEDNAAGGRRRGGSTITQQTAKNVFLWNGGGYARKAVEAYLALLIDFTWGKSRVMEVYLNVAEWGDSIFGIEAAAQARFGKSAKDLTRREAALLASVLPSPNKWRVDPPSDFVAGRASTLQQRMAVIRNSQYASCIKGSLPPLPPQPKPAKTDEPEPPAEEIEEPSTPQAPAKESNKPDAKQPAAPDTPTVSQPTGLEDVLHSAEQSLDKMNTPATEESDMTETPKPQTPDIPAPTDPASIPTPKPANRPAPAQTPEIPQEITPDQPQPIPSEIPNPNPPTEIPHDIATERADEPKPEF